MHEFQQFHGAGLSAFGNPRNDIGPELSNINDLSVCIKHDRGVAYKRVIRDAEGHGLILVVSQRRHAHDDAPMCLRGRLCDDDPEVRSYFRPRCRDQEGVAATHPRVSTATHECLYHSKTLNLALDKCNLRFAPICRS